MKRLPLDGILVADFSRVLAGPLCTQMLGDAGARVVKVEETLRGDETRHWGPPFVGDVSAYFLSINRNKQSLALDLKRGGDVARKLLERADVVVDNFLPAQRVALGLDRVREINPRAIHCRIAGYDSDGANAATPGYDLLAQAAAGLMAITGEADGDPMKVGVAVSDVLTAHYAFGAITSALFARERTGEGASIEISLFGATIASLVNVAQNALVTEREAKRYSNAHASIVPYQLFHAKDRPFAIGAGTDRHFRALCEVVARPELARDRRFATNVARVKNRTKLLPLLDAIFRTRNAKTWVTRCTGAAIPAAVVQGVREALESEDAQPLIASLEHPSIGEYSALRNPLRVDGKRLPAGTPPPLLGQHTDAILRELGYSSRDVAQLRRDGVIGARPTSGAARGRTRG
ncbi:MAG TPA: CoA transferase [Thermoanaerobaculia bacterium]|nr:CoA transferase [Thermoanaerobaculia bacterium]